MVTYVSYRIDGLHRVGELHDGLITPLVGIDAIGGSVGSAQLAAAARDETDRVPLFEVTLLPVVARPARILCVGLNYADHIAETGRELPSYPVLFPKFASSLIGANDAILLPAESKQVDYEGELAVIIGTAGRRISEGDALAHVLGYSVANDVTMRDYQYKTHQWLQGKAWDNSTPIGPAIITPDQVDLSSAGIRTTLNGTVVQQSDLSQLIFTVPKLIAQASEFTSLEPGDVILTGTPGGVGYRRDPQLFLTAGDIIEVEIDGVGRIENPVAVEEALTPIVA